MTQKTLNIAIIIIAILCLSAAAVFAVVPGRQSSDTSTSDVAYLLSNKNPITAVSGNSAAKVSLQTVKTKYGERTAIISNAVGNYTGAYCTASLKKIDLYNYETYSVEFDVFTPEGAGALLGHIHLSLMNEDRTSNYYFQNSGIRMKNIDGDKFTLTVGDTTTNAKNEFHVEYRFNINKYDMTKSTLSVYIDGVLAFDSSELDSPIFAEGARYVHSVKIKELYSYEGGSVVLANLKMKGITR